MIMKYLKTYKIYESDDTSIIYEVEDILNELKDVGLEYEITKRRNYHNIAFFPHLEVRIKRPNDSVDREIPGAPVPPGGKYGKDIFLWKEVKDVVIRLNEWYFQEFENTNFKMYNSGNQFGVGWNKEEDFSGLGDLISFINLKIVFRIK